ncbi:lantibiotic dehydratase [Pendulispora rubella]|uniref:Lantibiotic dehydratase n=1 Tax=Pendulispora rubella TaxID=2741070 RepID=A0ABZ2LBQ3_9BACT
MAPEREFVHHGACVVRTPLLPFRILRDGLTRERLLSVLKNPVVREALFLASPSLDTAIDAWMRDPNAPRAHDVELTVARYISRAASRSTPFGLFAGCALASLGESTSLTGCAPGEARRSSRLDMQYLFLLAEAALQDDAARDTVRFRPNSSLSRMGDELRYYEARVDARSRTRGFHLVTVEATAPLQSALDAASSMEGASRAAIARGIVEADASIPPSAAAAFVDELIEARILEPSLQVPVTGDEPLTAFTECLLASGARAMAGRIARAGQALRGIDTEGVGVDRDRYRAIVSELESLPVPLDPARLFQVDLFKPATTRVGTRIVAEVRRAVSLLHAMTDVRGAPAMQRFRERFEARYGDREVPLALALDEEQGIGFDAERSRDPSPLLDGIAFPAAPARSDALREGDAYKLERLFELQERGQRIWQLDERDRTALAAPAPSPLPDAFSAMVTVAARSCEAIDRGDFELPVHQIGGPSGAPLLARFCHGDPAISNLVARHLRAEEQCQPQAIFAEIVHLPEGRVGNVICRPVLRSHEIAYLGTSGAPPEACIPIEDLRVSVRHGIVRLRSVRLHREIRPRLSSAHNHPASSLAMYRFLCALQYEGVAPALRWDWGPLERAPFLPRVACGKIVLALATWTVNASEVAQLATDADFRGARGIPSWITVKDGDHTLPIDLDGDGAAAQLSALARNRQKLRIQELFPDPEHLCAHDPHNAEERYAHEIVIPFVRTSNAAAREPVVAPRREAHRAFPPGSEWLFAKIYTGPVTADRVLRHIGPLLRELTAERAIEQWFFLRYADPEPHLRLRCQGAPDRLMREVWPRLLRHLEPWLASGAIAKLTLDTYEPETGRYGGPQAIAIAERMFAADSEAALAAVEGSDDDSSIDARWRWALWGTHMALRDAGFDDASRHALAQRGRDAYAAEHRLDANARKTLAARYRLERARIERLLEGHGDPALAPLLPLLEQRSRTWRPAWSELRALHDAGRLETPLDDMAMSLVHMHINRVIRADARAHEMVIYDFLLRTYESFLARRRK